MTVSRPSNRPPARPTRRRFLSLTPAILLPLMGVLGASLALAGAPDAHRSPLPLQIPGAFVQPPTLTFRTYWPSDFGRPDLADQGFGRVVARGDWNGDGSGDLAIGAPQDSQVERGAGWLGLVLGGARFPGPVIVDGGPEKEERDGAWGSVLAFGDLNRDRTADLVVGYPLRDFAGSDSGVIWLIDGSKSGRIGLSRPIGQPPTTGSQIGSALAVGDFSGDGVDDLALGAPGENVQGQSGAGQVTVLQGREGAGPVSQGSLTLDRTGTAVPGEPSARELFGSSLAAADLDGDGDDDLAIGIPGGDANARGPSGTPTPGVRDAGSVLIALLGTYPITRGLRVDSVEEVARGPGGVPGEAARGGGFGSVLAAADFDADGSGDLVLASPAARVDEQNAAGDVVVLYGGAGGRDPSRDQPLDQTRLELLESAEARDGCGSALATGDLNGDRYPDLAIGCPGEALGGLPGVGGVMIVYGGPMGLTPRGALAIAPGIQDLGFPPANRQAFGAALAIADLNGDGVADLLVGAPGMARDGTANVGAFVIGFGPHEGLPGVATPTVPPPTPSPRPTASRTPRPSATPSPTASPDVTATPTPPPSSTPRATAALAPALLPYAARIGFLNRLPTPKWR